MHSLPQWLINKYNTPISPSDEQTDSGRALRWYIDEYDAKSWGSQSAPVKQQFPLGLDEKNGFKKFSLDQSDGEINAPEGTETKTEQKWPTPPIDDGLRALAIKQPNGWVSVVDADFQGDIHKEPPTWAVQGSFLANSNGQLLEETYLENPDYRPGPRKLGFRKPTSRLERALELKATKYASLRNLIEALTEPDVTLITPRISEIIPADSGQEVTIATPLLGPPEQKRIHGFTSSEYVPAGTPVNPAMPTSALALMLDESHIMINPKSPQASGIVGSSVLTILNETTSRLDPRVNVLASALSKMPTYDDIVVRGLKVQPKDLESVLSQYEPGTVVNERAFVDTTLNIPRKANVLYVIYGGGGCDAGVDENGERLIVFRAMSRFTVIRRVYYADMKTWVIVLKSEGDAQ